MLALIKSENGDVFPVLKGKKYLVGKLNADLVIPNDKSISGLHAALHCKELNENMTDFHFELEDLGSKNGTFVNADISNRKPMIKKAPLKLMEGDQIRFGVFGNLWHVRRNTICAASSGLNLEEIQILENCLNQLGGKHVLKWENTCSYLTMNEIKVTLKVMYALLEGVNIVTVDFWQDLLKVARKEKKGPILHQNYLPRVSDVLLAQQNVDLRKPMDRKSVFKNKTFIFLNQKHLETYAPIVERAGASSRGLKSGVQKPFLLRENVIVVQYVPSTESQNTPATQTINGIVEYLVQNGRRFIPDYEIALAIINGSTEKYCNPDYKIIPNMLSFTSTLEDSESVFVENTNPGNSQKPAETCDLVVGETEPNINVGDKATNTQKVESITKVFNELFDDSTNHKETAGKRTHSDVFLDNESDTEKMLFVAKRPCKDVSTVQTLGFSEKNASSSKISVQTNRKSVFKPLNVTISKAPRPKRLPNISDDEDDLFNFGDEDILPEVPTKKKRHVSPSKNAEQDNLFQFADDSEMNPSNINENNCLDDVSTQPFVSKTVVKSTAFSLPKPKAQPDKYIISDWKSFSGKNHSSICCKKEMELDKDDESMFKGFFRVKKFDVVFSRSRNVSSFGEEDTISKANSKNRTKPIGLNFKKFTKQKLIRPSLEKSG